jgi:hypothetical protein
MRRCVHPFTPQRSALSGIYASCSVDVGPIIPSPGRLGIPVGFFRPATGQGRLFSIHLPLFV